MQTTRTPYSISFMATVLLLLLFACHDTMFIRLLFHPALLLLMISTLPPMVVICK